MIYKKFDNLPPNQRHGGFITGKRYDHLLYAVGSDGIIYVIDLENDDAFTRSGGQLPRGVKPLSTKLAR